jgi:hypothetical protein
MSNDTENNDDAIRILSERGDLSSLSTEARQVLYLSVCKRLGLDPIFAPLNYLRLQGKLVLYVTRTATDQLARNAHLSREIIDGPRVLNVDGTKMFYAVCRVRGDNGREECSVATLPLVDPVNGLMKIETKAKRRATLAFLGLAVLDDEKDDRDADEDEPTPSRVDASSAARLPSKLSSTPIELQAFSKLVADMQDPLSAASLWIEHRKEISTFSEAVRTAAWSMITSRVVELGVASGGKWLIGAIAKQEAEGKSKPKDEAAVSIDADPLSPALKEELDELSVSIANGPIVQTQIASRLASFWMEKKGCPPDVSAAIYGALSAISKTYSCRNLFDRAVEAAERSSDRDGAANGDSDPGTAKASDASATSSEPPQEEADVRSAPLGSQATDQPATGSPAPAEEPPSPPATSQPAVDPRIQSLRVDLNKAVTNLRSIEAACAVWLHHAKLLPSTLKAKGYEILEKALRVLDPSVDTQRTAELLTQERDFAVEHAKARDFCGPVDLELWKKYIESSSQDGRVAASFAKRSDRILQAHGKTAWEGFRSAAIARIAAIRGCSDVAAATLLSDVAKHNENRRQA